MKAERTLPKVQTSSASTRHLMEISMIEWLHRLDSFEIHACGFKWLSLVPKARPSFIHIYRNEFSSRVNERPAFFATSAFLYLLS